MSELVLSSLYLDIRAVLSGDAVQKSENDECNDKSWNFEAIVGEKDVRSDRLTFQLPRQFDTVRIDCIIFVDLREMHDWLYNIELLIWKHHNVDVSALKIHIHCVHNN